MAPACKNTGFWSLLRKLNERFRCFGSRRPRVRIPPSRQRFSNVLPIICDQGGNRRLSPHVGLRGSVSAHVGSHLPRRPDVILRVEPWFARLLRSAQARRRVIRGSGRLAACPRSPSGECRASCSVCRAVDIASRFRNESFMDSAQWFLRRGDCASGASGGSMRRRPPGLASVRGRQGFS